MGFLKHIAEMLLVIDGQHYFRDLGFSASDIVDVLEGIVHGIAYPNGLTSLDACGKDLDSTIPDIEKIIFDVKAKNWAGAIADVKTLIGNAKSDLTDCKAVATGTEGARLKSWITQYLPISTGGPKIIAHYALHAGKITKDIAAAKNDFGNGNYTLAGGDAADIVNLLLGPVPASYEPVPIDILTI